jgi:hypothetical protein
LIYGSTDTIATEPDVLRLKTLLESQNSLIICKHAPNGHMGLLNPAEGHGDHLEYMINQLMKEHVKDKL